MRRQRPRPMPMTDHIEWKITGPVKGKSPSTLGRYQRDLHSVSWWIHRIGVASRKRDSRDKKLQKIWLSNQTYKTDHPRRKVGIRATSGDRRCWRFHGSPSGEHPLSTVFRSGSRGYRRTLRSAFRMENLYKMRDWRHNKLWLSLHTCLSSSKILKTLP